MKWCNVASFPAPHAVQEGHPVSTAHPAPLLRPEDLEEQHHVSLTLHSLVWPVSELGINGVILYIFCATHCCSSTDTNHLFLLLPGLPLCDTLTLFIQPSVDGFELSSVLLPPPFTLSPSSFLILPSASFFSLSSSSSALLLLHSCKQLCCKHRCPGYGCACSRARCWRVCAPLTLSYSVTLVPEGIVQLTHLPHQLVPHLPPGRCILVSGRPPFGVETP